MLAPLGLASPQSRNAPWRSPSPLSHRINTTCPILFQVSFTIPLHPSVSPPLSALLARSAAGSSLPSWLPCSDSDPHLDNAKGITRLATAVTPRSRSCSLSCSLSCSNLLSLAHLSFWNCGLLQVSSLLAFERPHPSGTSSLAKRLPFSHG